MNFFDVFAAWVTTLCIAEGNVTVKNSNSKRNNRNWGVIVELQDIEPVEPHSWTVMICEIWDVVDVIISSKYMFQGKSGELQAFKCEVCAG